MELLKEQIEVKNSRDIYSSSNKLSREEAKRILGLDFNSHFPLEVKELFRPSIDNKETITQILRRTAVAVAIAKLKFSLNPAELVQISLDKAIDEESVLIGAAKYYNAFGEKLISADIAAYLNSSPDISLAILQYEAHGELIGMTCEQIWQSEAVLRAKYEKLSQDEKTKVKSWIAEVKSSHANDKQKAFYPNVIEKAKHESAMGYYAAKFKNKGILTRSAVTYPGDSIEDFDNVTSEILNAAKATVSIGINTSSIRPKSTQNSDGSIASGPKSFFENLFKQAVMSVANGAEEKATLIELRDTNHPDITEFLTYIENEELALPDFAAIYDVVADDFIEIEEDDFESTLKEREVSIFKQAIEVYGKAYADYDKAQAPMAKMESLVRCVDGFMEYVEKREWYPVKFNATFWKGDLFDYSKPLLDDEGNQKVNPLNNEGLYETYSVNIEEFPDALESAQRQGLHLLRSDDGSLVQVKRDGSYCFYAPDIFKRLCTSISKSSKLRVLFQDHINERNANSHIADLNTISPIFAEVLPAQTGKNGVKIRGVSNQLSINVTSKSFWDENENFNWQRLENIALLATDFVDDISSISHFPNSSSTMSCRFERRGAINLVGVADFLIKSRMEMCDDDSYTLINKLFDQFASACIGQSKKLALSKSPYELWQGSSYYTNGVKMRNTSLICQASNDFTARFFGTSPGVEPYEKIVLTREVSGKTESYAIPSFVKAMQSQNAWPYSEEMANNLLFKILENGNKVTGLDEVPLNVQSLFKTASEIAPENYIKYLSAIQAGNGSVAECFPSLESSFYMSSGVTPRSVASVLLNAYKSGLANITFHVEEKTKDNQAKKVSESNIEELLRFVPTDVLVDLDLIGLFQEVEEDEFDQEENAAVESYDESEEEDDDEVEDDGQVDAEASEEEVEEEVNEEVESYDEADEEEETEIESIEEQEVENEFEEVNEDEEIQEDKVCELLSEAVAENTDESQVKITPNFPSKIEIMSITEPSKANDFATSEMIESKKLSEIKVRPKRLYGFNEEVITPEGSVRVHVYFDGNGPCEVFAHYRGSDTVTSQMSETICRMATKMLKCGFPPEDVASELLTGGNLSEVEANSMSDAIGRVLLEALEDQQKFLELNSQAAPAVVNETLNTEDFQVEQ